MKNVTTEQLGADTIRTVELMTAQEKAVVRRYLDGIFAESDREFLMSCGVAPWIPKDNHGKVLDRKMDPIPEGHIRLRASDGTLHDIPAENIGLVRKIDPLLIVLNPWDFFG